MTEQSPPAKVADLAAHRRARSDATAGFLGCPHCGHDEFAVVCRAEQGRAHIAALLCAVCEPEVEIRVTEGRL